MSFTSYRVMSYNILANCYSETSLAKEKLYPYCPLEFLEFKYRRLLIVHEIKSTLPFFSHKYLTILLIF